MSDLFSEKNIFGLNILWLVSRGNAIVAEIFRLRDFVPTIYRLASKEDQQKYGEILLDFTYFKQIDEFEKKIESNAILRDRDNGIKENNFEIITRFYMLFESIHNYVIDLNTCISELEEGFYIQQTFDTVFNSDDEKQLMCEALYLYGIMLLIVDSQIDGLLRERLVVSYYRYNTDRSSSNSNVDDVCKLLRSTVIGKPAKKPINYPEDYFKRISLSEMYVNMVIGTLRTDDIYHQLKVYPLPEDRSTGLATQAAMLVVCLFFQPATLHSQTSVMREIVDKYFPDNWVVSLYMGEILNLIVAWEPFKAAKAALNNTLDTSNLNECCLRITKKFKKTLPNVVKLNLDVLNENHVLERSQKLIQLIRDGNVALRWIMLHVASAAEGNKKCRQIRDQIIINIKYKPTELFQFLFNLAELELHLKEILRKLLSEKEKTWQKMRDESIERLSELADAFSGEKPLIRLQKNDKLHSWFNDIGKQIKSLDLEHSNTGRKLIQLIQALEKVQEFHNLSGHAQVKQMLEEVGVRLQGMLRRTAALNEQLLIQLQVIADMSYAWMLMHSYTPLMQHAIKHDPSTAGILRATFLKMASALEVPLLRINLAQSPDLLSVSQYYSTELVGFVRKVLHIIPETMFHIMAQIAQIQTSNLKQIPTRLNKHDLRDYAQLDKRFQVSKLTHDVSILTEGMTMMKTTLVGVIRIDPIQLLEDGIRQELVKHIATALDNGIVFSVNKNKVGSDLIQKLDKLGDTMDGHKRSFEYIQDYVHVYGLKIWQEELARIIRFSIEQECNANLKNKIHSDWQNKFEISIPTFAQKDGQSINFMGRLYREILRITDPKTTIYLEQTMAWYDAKTKEELIDLYFFSKITRCVEIPGLSGIDQLLCHTLSSHISDFTKMLMNLSQDREWMAVVAELGKILGAGQLIAAPGKILGQIIGRVQKSCMSLLNLVLKIGQVQLLRKHVSYELSIRCQFEAPDLFSSLVAFNEAVLSKIHKSLTEKFDVQDYDELTANLSDQLDLIGLFNPNEKIYGVTRPIRHLPLSLFLFTWSQLGKLSFSTSTENKRTGDTIDAMPFISGIQTILHHFHEDSDDQYLLYLSTFIKSCVLDSISRSKLDVPEDVVTTIRFLQILLRLEKQPVSKLVKYIPQILLDV